MANQAQKNYIKRLSDKATQIQQEGGKKTIPAKEVFKITRSQAVKKASLEIKAVAALNKLNKK